MSDLDNTGKKKLRKTSKQSKQKRKEVTQSAATSSTSVKTYNVKWTKEEHALYESLGEMSMEPTRYMDRNALEKLGLLDDVERFFNAIGWTHFIKMCYKTYRDITLEFLATLNVSYPNKLKKASQGSVTFKLGNVKHTISVMDVCRIFGFPENEDVKFKKFKNRAWFWEKIATPIKGPYNSHTSKASHVRNPAIRYALRMMDYSFFTGSNNGGATCDEVAIIFQALKKNFVVGTNIWSRPTLVKDELGDAINYGALLLHQLMKIRVHANKPSKKTKSLFVGGIISPIAEFCGVDLSLLEPIKGTMALDINVLRKLLFISSDIQDGIFYKYFNLEHQLVRCLLPQKELTNLTKQENWGFQPTRIQRQDPKEDKANEEDETSNGTSTDEDEPPLHVPQHTGFQANGDLQNYVVYKMEEHTRLLNEIINWKDVLMLDLNTSSGTQGFQTIESQRCQRGQRALVEKRKSEVELVGESRKKATLRYKEQEHEHAEGVERLNNLVGDCSGLETWEKEFSSTSVIKKIEDHTGLLKEIINKVESLPIGVLLHARKNTIYGKGNKKMNACPAR